MIISTWCSTSNAANTGMVLARASAAVGVALSAVSNATSTHPLVNLSASTRKRTRMFLGLKDAPVSWRIPAGRLHKDSTHTSIGAERSTHLPIASPCHRSICAATSGDRAPCSTASCASSVGARSLLSSSAAMSAATVGAVDCVPRMRPESLEKAEPTFLPPDSVDGPPAASRILLKRLVWLRALARIPDRYNGREG